MTRTIPEPTHDEFHIAFSGALFQARAFALDLTDHGVNDFLVHQAETIAQKDAEIRWLRNLLHKERP